MHQVGWKEVPLVAMETVGADSLAACAKAGEWVELDDITRWVGLVAEHIPHVCHMSLHSLVM